ncbi:SIR2 family protein [Pseudomonas oryzihabitans]|nr:SIR2 family protein [Pseudomonas psychrotolerans]
MTKATLNRFLKEFPSALTDGTAAIFVGAGVSMAAGYPSWSKLLYEIGEELGVNSSSVHDLAALAQWSIQANGGATRVRQIIKREILPEKPIPDAIKVIARLPTRSIWTTNYDRLIERAFQEIRRPLDVTSSGEDLALKATPGATRLYKMHGSIDRLDDVVISTDDYELFRSRRGAFLPLFQAHLTSMSMLFIGISFTDPNIKHVLSLIRESFTNAPPEHFAIIRPPQRKDFKRKNEFEARLAQHKLWAKDLKRYGLLVVEVDDYEQVPELLMQIERRVASRRVWVSGSWTLENQTGAANIHYFSETVGLKIGETNRDLVTGAGLLVGSASISGFLSSLRTSGAWDLERRLIARPFPQPLTGETANKTEWTALRTELARQAGITIFIGGQKYENGKLKNADGVLEEFYLAKHFGSFLIPVGATGGTARFIAEELISSNIPDSGPKALRPTDQELFTISDSRLLETEQGREKLKNSIFKIIDRIEKTN